MRHLLQFILLLPFLLGALPSGLARDRADTLRAINLVENPTNHTRRGSKGELGPYQFRPQTWRLHTTRSFSLATVRQHADEVATKHYDWLKAQLAEAGVDPSPFNIALAWNSGVGAVLRGRVPLVSYDYAQRVTNLVQDQKERRLLAQPRVRTPQVDFAGISFSSARVTAPRFLIADGQSLYEPTVSLENVVTIPVLTIDAPALGHRAGSMPPLALIR